VTFTEFTEIS